MTDRRQIVSALVTAGSMIAVSAALALATIADVISSDLAVRGTMVMIGLVCVIGSANAVPKTARPTAPSARQQSAMRLYGWAMTLAGVVWVILWVFAPIGLAGVVAPAGVLSVLVVWIVFCARVNLTAWRR